MIRLLRDFDAHLAKQLYWMAAKSPGREKLAVLTTKLSSKVFQIIYIGFILFLLVSGDIKIIPFLLGPATGLVLTRSMRRLWMRRRPFVKLRLRRLIKHKADNSFPSMHAMSAFVIGMSIWFIHPLPGVLVLLLAGATGLSRVMVGVHYPSDILAGAAIGIGTSLGIFSLITVFFSI